MAAYYQANRERLAAASLASYHALTDEQRLDQRRRAHANDAGRPARKREYREKLKLDVIEGYGGACACCGNEYLPHLTLDHVNGGGRAERAALGGGANLYRLLRREGFPEGYQVLCFNCNAAKHFLGRCACSDGEG